MFSLLLALLACYGSPQSGGADDGISADWGDETDEPVDPAACPYDPATLGILAFSSRDDAGEPTAVLTDQMDIWFEGVPSGTVSYSWDPAPDGGLDADGTVRTNHVITVEGLEPSISFPGIQVADRDEVQNWSMFSIMPWHGNYGDTFFPDGACAWTALTTITWTDADDELCAGSHDPFRATWRPLQPVNHCAEPNDGPDNPSAPHEDSGAE